MFAFVQPLAAAEPSAGMLQAGYAHSEDTLNQGALRGSAEIRFPFAAKVTAEQRTQSDRRQNPNTPEDTGRTGTAFIEH